MKFTASTRRLREAAKLCAVALGSSVPVFGCIRVAATEGEGLCEAFNGSFRVAVRFDAAVSETGRAVVAGRSLLRFLDAVDGDESAIDVDRTHAVLRSASAALRLGLVDASEWADSEPLTGVTGSWEAADLRTLNRVLFAASRDTMHPLLMGVHFKGHTATTTDKKRLAQARLSADLPAATCPAEPLRIVLRHELGPCSVTVSERSLTISSADTVWTISLLSGSYPDVDRLLLASPQYRMTLDSQALLRALARMAAIDPEHGFVVFERDGGGTVSIETTRADVGRVDDQLPADGSFRGRIAFSIKALEQAIEAHAEPSVDLELEDPLKAVLLRSADVVQMLMPRKFLTD